MSFAKTLRRLREKAGITVYKLAMDSNVDQAYIRRLEDGERRTNGTTKPVTNPTRDTVIKLGLGLVYNKVDIEDVNELLLSANYAPLRGRGEQLPALV